MDSTNLRDSGVVGEELLTLVNTMRENAENGFYQSAYDIDGDLAQVLDLAGELLGFTNYLLKRLIHSESERFKMYDTRTDH